MYQRRAAAPEAGLEFQRGRKEFLPVLEEISSPNLGNREPFRGVFDGRYKLVRHFGLGHHNLPESVDELLADNNVALYDLFLDPEEMKIFDGLHGCSVLHRRCAHP